MCDVASSSRRSCCLLCNQLLRGGYFLIRLLLRLLPMQQEIDLNWSLGVLRCLLLLLLLWIDLV